jgi:hypothetical protein
MLLPNEVEHDMKNYQARSLALFYYLFKKFKTYICILVVLRKKQFLSPSAAVVASYQWRQRVNMILVVIVIWRKRVQNFFILTL